MLDAMDDLTDEFLAVIDTLPIASTGRLPQLVEDAWPAYARRRPLHPVGCKNTIPLQIEPFE